MSPTPSTPDPLPGRSGRTDRFLAGGGEMGALLRAHDWSASPLGPPDTWPASLRTVVRLMLNTGHPMYIWWGDELACLYNDAYRQSIGPERHPSSIGRPAREVWAEIWDVIHPQIELVMTGRGAPLHVDQLVPITRNGRREDVYWTYSYSPIDDETAPSGVGGVLVLCTETTEHVLSARRIAAERDSLAQLFEQAPSFMALLRGPEHRFEIANAALLRLLGQKDVVGRTVAEVLPPAALAAYAPLLDRVYATGIAHADTAARVAPLPDSAPPGPESQRILDIVLQPICDGDGKVTGVFIDGVDVTARVQAEQRLAVGRERLELALVAGQMGAFEMNLERSELWWSAQTYAVFGVDPASFELTPENVLGLIHPDDREPFIKLRAEAIAQRRPFVHELRTLRPDGTIGWIAHRGRAEYDEHGRALRNFGVVMDIAERKRAEELLRDADRQKDTFIAVLAHELRNPLAPIRNAIDLLRRAPGDERTAAWCRDVIDRQVRQMARLLDDLLDVSRLSRGQLRLRPERLRLMQAIEQAIEIATPMIDAARHTFTLIAPDRTLELSGDLARLAQIYSNVLINAAKYTPAGGHITMTVGTRDGHAVVTVSDDGNGIAAADLDRIFEMFGQVGGGAQGGLGIGLSLARRLALLHGGSVEARSAGPGLGSEFEIRLPLLTAAHAPATTDAPDAPETSNVATERDARPARRILVADDLRDTADSLARLLAELGHHVIVAYDGEDALRQAEAHRPEIVLLDLGMPKIDGCEVARRIRAQTWSAGMRLIAQTGWGQESDRQRTREAGFDAHFVKPLDMAALLAAVESKP